MRSPGTRASRSTDGAVRRRDRGGRGEEGGRTDRGHELLPHTADAGLAGHAPDLPGAFEEAAAALAELGADIPDGAPVVEASCGTLTARDLPGLAFAWLNELVGRAAAEGAALEGGRVGRLEPSEGCWELDGTARLARFGPGGAAFRRDVKAVTFHRLTVEDDARGWTLTAYVDL